MIVDDFGRDEVSGAVSNLQKIAGTFSLALPGGQSMVTLQVVFVVGAKHPWRLLETARSSSHRRRRMLCFNSVIEIQCAIDQYLAWQHADEQFVATHMVTPGGFPGVTTDWVPSTQFESFFASSRESIRAKLCAMSAECGVALPHR
jgi:hypothetical protein